MIETRSYSSITVHDVEQVVMGETKRLTGSGTRHRTLKIKTKGGLHLELSLFSDTAAKLEPMTQAQADED